MDCLAEVTGKARLLVDKVRGQEPNKEDAEKLVEYIESLVKLAWDERDCWAENERRLARACLERDEAVKKYEDLRRRCTRVIGILDDATDLLED